MDPQYFDSLDEQAAMEPLNQMYQNGPKKALSSHRKMEPPILTGFKIYLDLDKAIARQVGELIKQCGKGVLTILSLDRSKVEITDSWTKH